MSEEVTSIEKKQVKENDGGGVNLGRHQAQCTICLSPHREQIEEEWINWYSPKYFRDIFNVSRYTLCRHARAFDLFSIRRRNLTMALENIIERGDWTAINGSVLLSAIKLHVKINSAGQGVEQTQGTDLRKSLARMSKAEREAFIRDGSLPDWFSTGKAATADDSQEGEKGSEVTENKALQ